MIPPPQLLRLRLAQINHRKVGSENSGKFHDDVGGSWLQLQLAILTAILGCANPERCLEKCGDKYGCENQAFAILVFKLLEKGKSVLVFLALAGKQKNSTN